MAMILKRYNVI